MRDAVATESAGQIFITGVVETRGKVSPPIIKARIYYRTLHCGANLLSRLDLSPAETSLSALPLKPIQTDCLIIITFFTILP